MNMTPARLALLYAVERGEVYRSEGICDLYAVYNANGKSVTRVAHVLFNADLIQLSRTNHHRFSIDIELTDAGRAALAEAGEHS